jgi:hypothetical protein
MTPTKKKYSKRLGKLYWKEYSRWDYDSGEQAIFLTGYALVIVERLARQYGDSGDYVYYLRPLNEVDNKRFFLRNDGYFRERANCWNDVEYTEYKPGDPLNGEHLLKQTG